ARSVSLSSTLRASETPCPAGADGVSGSKKVRCDRCGGRGYTSWHPGWDNGCDPCPVCGGSGKVKVT
ncbi:hypothetical protein KUV28_21835, partial [Ferrimonas balearica]|nr:hypothetical protein [Ferrimonas balearica]